MDKQYQIPSSVASKLEQIKLYMGTHSVTAFVGAGFSMNAEIPSNVSMKTWAQLREVFLDKLYPNNEEDKKNEDNDVVRLSSLVDAAMIRPILVCSSSESPSMLVSPDSW